MHYKDIKRLKMHLRHILYILLVISCICILIYFLLVLPEATPIMNTETQIYDKHIESVPYNLHNFSVDKNGNAYGSKNNELFRIVDKGEQIELVYKFPNRINSIHIMDNDYFVVATDDDWWDTQKPCKIYCSKNKGTTFELIKILKRSSALWWSISSDKKGNLYVGEYGPKGEGISKNVWKSMDYGKTWSIIFSAPNRKGHHIHRVAVDPYTGFLWVTYGDDDSGIYMSKNEGDTWEKLHRSQPTAIAFTKDAIYFGADCKAGIIRRYDRIEKTLKTVFNASKLGNFGGSVYDMGVGRNGLIYIPFQKYGDQDHYATLWVGNGKDWQLLMTFKKDIIGGASTISNPDKYGMLYITGFKIEDN